MAFALCNFFFILIPLLSHFNYGRCHSLHLCAAFVMLVYFSDKAGLETCNADVTMIMDESHFENDDDDSHSVSDSSGELSFL